MDNINWVLAELMKVKPGGASAYRAYNVGGLLGGFLVFKIHVHLRIRETDAVGVEVALNAFQHVPVYVLQIAAFAPDTHHKVNGGSAEFIQANRLLFVFQNAIVRSNDVGNQRLHLIDGGVVCHADNQFVTTHRLTGEVDDVARDNFPVRHDHDAAIDGTHSR